MYTLLMAKTFDKQLGFSGTLILAAVLVPSFIMGGYFLVDFRSAQNERIEKANAAREVNSKSGIKETAIIDGKLTKIEPSCEADWILGEDGQPTRSSDINVCDAGTFVVVNDIEIQTQSGYQLSGAPFSRSVSNLKPGQMVQVKYLMTSDTSGTLACETCVITVK